MQGNLVETGERRRVDAFDVHPHLTAVGDRHDRQASCAAEADMRRRDLAEWNHVWTPVLVASACAAHLGDPHLLPPHPAGTCDLGPQQVVRMGGVARQVCPHDIHLVHDAILTLHRP